MSDVHTYFSGNAKHTSLLTQMTAASPSNGGTIQVSDATGYPTLGAFVITINRGQDNEEQLLISSRSGSTFVIDTTQGRGYAGSTAQAHSVDESVEHTWDANSASLLMDHVWNTARDDHGQYLTQFRHELINHTNIALTDGSVTRSKLDPSLMPVIQCTFSPNTRPLNPVLGQIIFESDTTRYMRWNGLAWIPLNSGIVTPMAKIRGVGGSTTGTLAAYPMPTVEFDTDGMVDTAHTARLVCRTAGRFLVTWLMAWTGANNGVRQTFVKLNGGTVIGQFSMLDQLYATEPTAAHGSTTVTLAVNDYVELSGRSLSNASGSITAAVQTAHLTASFLGA